MYKKLKYSWTHIIAFLALIFIGYISYVGLTYSLNDGFLKPLWWTIAILIILALWFIGAQQLKGVDNNYNFAKCIIAERFFVFSSPIVLFLCLIPFNHAWNVASHSDEIENKFRVAIKSTSKLFDDYESYTTTRIKNYNEFLSRVKSNRSIHPDTYKKIGFNGKNDDHLIEIETETLKRQLTENYDSLSIEARGWIKRADLSTSVWNVFLVGNINEIINAYKSWNEQLVSFSSVILSTERYLDVVPFKEDWTSMNSVTKGLQSLCDIYKGKDKIKLVSIFWGILLFALLLFPYIMQKRNGVSTYTLFGRRYIGGGIIIDSPKEPDKQSHGEIVDNNGMPIVHSPDGVDDNELDEESERERRKRRRREGQHINENSRKAHRYIDEEDEDDFIKPIDNIE